MKKRILSMFLILTLLLSALSGCVMPGAGDENGDDNNAEPQKTSPIELSFGDITLDKGDEAQLVSSFKTGDTTTTVTYTFEGNNISIENGKVKALVADTTTEVTATADGMVTKTFKVTVNKEVVIDNSVNLAFGDVELTVNDSAKLVSSIKIGGKDYVLAYTFEGSNISITDGTLNALVENTETTVTATAENFTTTFKVKVVPAPVVEEPEAPEVVISLNDISLMQGTSTTLPEKIKIGEEEKTLTYTFEGANISIDGYVLKALVEKTETTVTAAAEDFTGTFKVTVTEIPVAEEPEAPEINVSFGNLSLNVGDKIALTSAIEIGGETKTLAYTFDGENISIESYVLTALKGETATTVTVNAEGFETSFSVTVAKEEVEMRPAQTVKILSANIKFSTTQEHEKDVEKRADMFAELVIKPIAPDSFGVQECDSTWEPLWEARFGDRYGRVGVDRDGNRNAASKSRFASCIYYLKDKYTLIASDTFWLSNEPDVPASPMAEGRHCTWALLEDVETGFRYVHINTHMSGPGDDPTSEVPAIRATQAQMLHGMMKTFEALGYPVFTTGDFNHKYETNVYEIMTSEGIADSRFVADESTEQTTTQHGAIVDYVFVVDKMVDVKKFGVVVINDLDSDQWVSDHNSVYAEIDVKSLPVLDAKTDVPKFDNAKVEFEYLTALDVEFTIPQATDSKGDVALFYRYELFDRNGALVETKEISSKYYYVERPETVSHMVSLPELAETYVVKVTPVGLMGECGKPFNFNIKSLDKMPEVEVNPEAIGNGDIVHIAVNNGEIVDLSGKSHTLSTNGTVTVNGSKMSLNNSAVKFMRLSDYYNNDTLADGFSISIKFRTGSDVTNSQHIATNVENGGFCTFVSGGQVKFQVIINSGDVTKPTAVADIAPNTEYHVVGVFDVAGRAIKLYLNGELKSTVILPENAKLDLPDSDTRFLCVGGDSQPNGASTKYFSGDVMFVGMYSEVLTAGNALYLYQQITAIEASANVVYDFTVAKKDEE